MSNFSHGTLLTEEAVCIPGGGTMEFDMTDIFSPETRRTMLRIDIAEPLHGQGVKTVESNRANNTITVRLPN